MPAPHPPRHRSSERGNSLLIALIVLSSLATLGSLTVVSVQSSLRASTNDRSQAIAMYAAESGGAAAMAFLREPARFDADGGWTAFVPSPPDEAKELTQLPSHNKPPGDLANELSPDQNAYFFIEIINNRSDPGYSAGTDQDGVVIIRSTGHGPQGSVAVIEWEVQRVALPPNPVSPRWTVPPESKGLQILSWHVVL